MSDALRDLPDRVRNLTGMPETGVSLITATSRLCVPHLGEYLADPKNQHGFVLFDGGWGFPPGDVVVQWIEADQKWVQRGWYWDVREEVKAAFAAARREENER